MQTIIETIRETTKIIIKVAMKSDVVGLRVLFTLLSVLSVLSVISGLSVILVFRLSIVPIASLFVSFTFMVEIVV